MNLGHESRPAYGWGKRLSATLLILLGVVFSVAAVALALMFLNSLGSYRKLGSYSTSLMDRSDAQLFNIRRAAEVLNGLEIAPNEIFSMNEALGDTSAVKGWKSALIYRGRSVDEAVAGGICQVSSTLYNAALLSGLEIVERSPHTCPILSVPPGRDAALAAGIVDLKIRNIRPDPVVIKADAESRLTISIRGAGRSAPAIDLRTTARVSGSKLIATLWAVDINSGKRRMISTDEYCLTR